MRDRISVYYTRVGNLLKIGKMNRLNEFVKEEKKMCGGSFFSINYEKSKLGLKDIATARELRIISLT